MTFLILIDFDEELLLYLLADAVKLTNGTLVC